jgi:DNA-binding transcriptional LysR family regulator
MILNMNQLRAFFMAAQRGSITTAAQELMVTPPAITMQIKHLEKTVGMRLLFREGNSIRLTEAGHSVFKKAKEIFVRIQKLENFLEDISTGKSGELRIGCPQTPASYIMPRLIAAFKDTYPGIKILLDQGSNSEMVQSILKRRNELALIRNVPDDRRLKIKVIGKAEVTLATAAHSKYFPGGEISVTQIAEAPMIVPPEGFAIKDVTFDYLNKFKVKPNLLFESASIGLIMEMIRHDKGISFLPKYAIDEEKAKGLREVRILEGAPTIEFGIGYLNRRDLSAAAWAFLRLLDKKEDLLPFSRS